MGADKNNIFDLDNVNFPLTQERFESLCKSDGGWVERIISLGHTSPEGEWYNQITDEWVLLLQGEAILEFENHTQTHLCKGDYLFLPSGLKHRVSYTSEDPPCIWIAIHFNVKQ
jgi:cupin 2 domain-containing protein